MVSVTNHGGSDVVQPLRIDVDDLTQVETTLEIGRGATVTYEADVPAGDRIEARLTGDDLLPGDDVGVASTGRRRDLRVLLVGPANPFLDEFFAIVPGLSVERVAELEPAADPGGGSAPDLVVFDRAPVPADPGSPFLAIAPPGGTAEVDVTGTVDRPVVTLVDASSNLVTDLDLTTVDIARAQQVSSSAGQVIVGAESAPLLVRGTSAGGVPFAYLTFALGDSNLPVQVSFPILFDRLVTELTTAALPPQELRVGAILPLDKSVETVVISPDGAERMLPVGAASPRVDRVGFWTVTANGVESTVAVNSARGESSIRPAQSLPIEVRPARAGEDPPDRELARLWWVALPLLTVLAAEWWWSRRRMGVSRGQWRLGQIARLTVAGLLVLALLGLSFDRRAGDVATVFLIDGSDSVSGPARAEALEWVQAALDAQPPNSRSAVAVFGADARLELTLDRDNQLATPSVQIDPTRTNLATALRLAAAVLPEDARRRVVLVSDGRANAGDVGAEAEALAARGIAVDVVAVDRSGLADVAVHSVDTPSAVREGELVTIDAVVEAGREGSVVVTLSENGVEVDQQVIATEIGPNDVSFEREAEAGGLVRYEIHVESATDAVPENDRVFAAVQVEGPARVLIVEDAPGEGTPIADALRAGGLTTSTVDVAELPPLDELGAFSSIVLVNVDERSLSDSQVQDLSRAVRDLGRGLVTIGGEHSYGLGGYYQSELEQLLPVVSEILDPERRQIVAEVLAIDTSGSMGNCHCGDLLGPSTPGDEGGVNKTDIARAAAAQAIEALSANDEIGVLAWNTSYEWVIDLQQVPGAQVIEDGLAELFPSGGTNMAAALSTSAAALRESQASLKHIILFSDGFTEVSVMEDLADEAAELAAEGITVSVIGTGEGSARQLEAIADAGNGRFYPGRDLQEIPEILQEEAMIASRDFVNEGSFLPEIVSSSPVIEQLSSSPPLLGYIATTAKPLATTLLRIGPDRDPLLASWQAGLGRVTSWTADAGDRWAQGWSDWDGFVEFWTRVVNDTVPTTNDGSVSAVIDDGELQIRVEGQDSFPDGATASARVSAPDGTSVDVPLRRIAPNVYGAELSVESAGTYAVGASVSDSSGVIAAGAALPSISYSAEYLPGPTDRATLEAIAAATTGRVDPEPGTAFAVDGLAAGRRPFDLAPWFLLAAALLWPLAVALGRLNLRASVVAYEVGRLGDWVRNRWPSRPGRERPPRPARARPAPPPEESEPSETLGRLLDRKRQRS